MSSVSKDMSCWLCPEKLEKKADLKNHAIVYHSVCRMICPWCTDEEKTFVRMSELTKHCKRRHQDLVLDLLDGDYFTEKNGFWLATKPHDYKKIIKPSERTSLIAIRTRAAVLGWVEKMGKKSSRTREEWEEGWKETLEQPISRKRKYSPSRPSIDVSTITICSVSLSSKGNFALMKNTEQNATVWYKIDLVHWVMEDKRAMDNLMRRMVAAQKGQEQGAPKEFTVELKDAQETVKELATTLGILEKHVRRVYRGSVQIVSRSKKDKKETSTKQDKEKVKKTSDKQDADKVKETETTTKEKEKVNSKEMTTSIRNNPEINMIKDAQDFGEEPEFEIVDTYEEEVLLEVEKEAHVVPEVTLASPLPSLNNICQKSDTNETEEEQEETENQQEELCTYKYTAMLSDDEGHEDTIKPLTDCRIVEVGDDPYEMETDEEKEPDTLRQRAEALLKTGGMPLFPPARRQWSNQEVLISSYPTPMRWPPSNWKELSPDQKLTAWRFAATCLSREKGLDQVINERDIMDTYAMLALPGTSVPRQNGEDHIIRARMANFRVVMDIHKGKISGSIAEEWLLTLEGNDSTHTEKRLVELLKEIPLRLSDS